MILVYLKVFHFRISRYNGIKCRAETAEMGKFKKKSVDRMRDISHNVVKV